MSEGEQQAGIQTLTAMERRVLTAFAATPRIELAARALGLKPNTIRSHLAAARRKLGTSDSYSAAMRFVSATHPKGTSPFRPIAEPDHVHQESFHRPPAPTEVSGWREDRAMFGDTPASDKLAEDEAPDDLTPRERLKFVLQAVVTTMAALALISGAKQFFLWLAAIILPFFR